MRKKLSVDHDLKSEETTLEEIFYKNFNKRRIDVNDVYHDQKRRRTSEVHPKSFQINDVITNESRSSTSDVIQAVERLSTNSDLVADGSRDNGLPTVAGKHKDLMAILPETVSFV